MKLDYFFKKQNDPKEHFLKWEELRKCYNLHVTDMEGFIGFFSLAPSFIAWMCLNIFVPSFIQGTIAHIVWGLGLGVGFLNISYFIWNRLTEKTNFILRFLARDNTTQYLESQKIIFEHINNENWQLEFIQQTTLFIAEARKIQLKHSSLEHLLDNMEEVVTIVKSHFVEASDKSIQSVTEVYQYYDKIINVMDKEDKLNMFDAKLASMEKKEYREYLEMQIGELQSKLRASI